MFFSKYAHWYHVDFRKHPTVRNYRSMEEFGKKLIFDGGRGFRIFESEAEFEREWRKFKDYKAKIRVCGAAILNENLTKLLLG